MTDFQKRCLAAKQALYNLPGHGHGGMRRCANATGLKYETMRHVLAGRIKGEPTLVKVERYIASQKKNK